MAIHDVSAAARAINPAQRSSHASHTVFRNFLRSLPGLIAAETDLAAYVGQDPALDDWIRDAECARSNVLVQIQNVRGMRRSTPHATLFYEIASIFQTVMTSDDPDEVAILRTQACALHETLQQEMRAIALSSASLSYLEAYLVLDNDPDWHSEDPVF